MRTYLNLKIYFSFQRSNFRNSLTLFEVVNAPPVATLYKKTSIESTGIEMCMQNWSDATDRVKSI